MTAARGQTLRAGLPSARTVQASLLLLAVLPNLLVGPASGQEAPPIGREAALALEPPPLAFDAPRPELHEVEGVRVLFLHDPALPLVDLFVRFRGGHGLFPRSRFAAATALPALVRSGGTRDLPPDSVNALLELHAIRTTFGSGGRSMSSSLDVLRSELDVGLELWTEMLRHPRLDRDQVEIWRGQELERVRRRLDDPGRLAVTEFNRLLFGDHSIGWEMGPEDLEPEDLSDEVLRELHRAVFCRENMILGAAGHVTWETLAPRLRRMLRGWPSCPGPLPEPPDPEIRTGGGVFLVPRDLEQSVVVMAHPGGIHRLHPDYFASRVANAILGSSGFSSRLMARVRTEAGYAYGVSSFWTAPEDHQGVVGALTRTRSGTTVAAARLVLDVMGELRDRPPTEDEVRAVVDEMVNGFVFNFQSAAQIVSREMLYLAEDMPRDWLDRFIREVQRVEPSDVHRVFREHLRPEEMTILLVGNPEAFDEPPSALGEVRIWEVEDPAGSSPPSEAARPGVSGSPGGGPRSRK